MHKYLNIIKQNSLFTGISESEIESLLGCLSATKKFYNKKEFVFLAGDYVTSVGIVLSGNVHIIQEDFWGNRTILGNIIPGGMFGEAFSCADIKEIPVSVITVEPTTVLFINYKKIITICSSACVYHTRLIENMLTILANKNYELTKKIQLLSSHSTREKLLTYLSVEAQRVGKSQFVIPYNRQELAEYLSVNRSAMSSELSKMSKEGILTYNRSKFKLHKTDE